MYIFGEHGIFLKDFKKIPINNDEVRNLIQPYVYGHPCLGHDLHLTRIIILDLLNKEKINSNDTIIVTKDRQFMYENIFKNIITYNEFVEKLNSNEIIFNEKELIFFPPIISDLLSSRLKPTNNSLYKNFNYDIDNSEYWNDKLVNNILNIRKYNINEELNKLIENKFIIFIIRTKTENDLCMEHLNQLKLIREKTNNKYKVILFCLKDSKIDEIISKDLYDFKIKNIQEYITLITHENCYFLLGEISGLVEISYYYHGPNLKILEYRGEYYKEENYFKNTFKNTIFQNWNGKFIEPINHKILKNFDEALNNIV